MLFVTVSTKVEDYDKLEGVVKDWLIKQNKTILCLKEVGNQGTHPHIHYVWETNGMGKNHLPTIRSRLQKANIDITSKYLVRTRKVHDLDGLLRYLVKDVNREVFKNTVNFDFTKLQSKPKYYTKKKWNFIPTFLEFSYFAKEYCDDNGLDIKKYISTLTINDLFKTMELDGINCIHLYRRQDDILRQMENLYM